ncbi:MAG: outer membrane beta-barrel protein [Gammaproteobacteria bacterium]|nr:outer membrane beta-barrel protein [Gammaproteobacteria bacterium]
MLLLSFLPGHAWAFDLWGLTEKESTDPVVLEVAEPFIEMHTGPGRGYPVFNVVEQGGSIEILMRRASWYKIRTVDNKTGWTSASSLAHTLEPTGVPVDLPEVSHGDYLESSWRIGFTSGQLEGSNSVSLTAGYRPLSWAGIEIEVGRFFDDSVTSDYYGINLLVEPASNWIVTPYVSLGIGEFMFNSRHKVLVNDTGSQNYGSAGAGVGYYFGRSIVVRGGYRAYSVSSNEDRVWLNAWTIGLSTFF